MFAAEKRLPYVAAFSDPANVVNQITRGWNKNERATGLYEEVEEALEPFKTWQLSRGPPRDEQRGRQACRSSLHRRASNPRHRLMKTSSIDEVVTQLGGGVDAFSGSTTNGERAVAPRT